MSGSIHSKLTGAVGEGIHVIHQFTFADTTGREASGSFVTADIGKIAKQIDDDTYWVLISTSPTWKELTGGGAHTHTESEITDLAHTPAEVQATEIAKGIAEIATQAEVDAGTDDLRIVTPLKLKNTPGMGGGGNSEGYRLSFASQEHTAIKAKDGTYKLLGTLIFDGSTKVGTPTKIKVTFTRKIGATGTLSIKIFDFTNTLQIVEKTGLTPSVDGTFEIGDLDAPSNIPAGVDNEWEVQAKVSVTGGGEESLIGYLQMEK